MNGLRVLTAALSFVVWTSCAPSSKGRGPIEKGVLTIVGTMRYLEIEGGCWQFQTDVGENFELVGELAAQLRVDGRRAKLRMKPRKDLASVCMAGKIAEVIEIVQVF